MLSTRSAQIISPSKTHGKRSNFEHVVEEVKDALEEEEQQDGWVLLAEYVCKQSKGFQAKLATSARLWFAKSV